MRFLDSLTRLLIPKNQAPPPVKRPDPDFLGESLALHFLFEHFGLKDDDFARLTAELTPDIQGPARLWITIYASWLYRMTVRAKYGDAVFDAAFAATKRRLEKKVEGYDGESFRRALEFWFDKLDSARTSLGAKFQDVEIPFEAFAAWTFLALDPDSPYQGKSELPSLLDLTVADCLEKAKLVVMPFIKFSVEIGGALPEDKAEAQIVANAVYARLSHPSPSDEVAPLTWSVNPGPAERRLRRQNANLLFPAERRIITQEQINAAVSQDEDAAKGMLERFLGTIQKILEMPDAASFAEVRGALEEIDKVAAECRFCSSAESLRWVSQLEGVANSMIAQMEQSLVGNPEASNLFKRYLDARQALFSENAALFEVQRLPSEDVVPTVCSMDPDDITLVLRAMPDGDAVENLRTACADALRRAITDGLALEQASPRLRALGIGL